MSAPGDVTSGDDVTADEQGRQAALPFGEQDDHPIPYRLTARARRAVAPGSLPPLAVLPDVPDDVDEHAEVDTSDTRPARARALRRAGLPVAAIARELRVDEVLAKAWCGDVPARRRRRVAAPAAVAAASASAADDGAADEPGLPAPRTRLTEAWEAFAEHRARGRAEVRDRLEAADPQVRGAVLVAGLLEVTPHAATVALEDPRLAAGVVRWLLADGEVDPRRLRVVLQLGPEVAADTAVHRWAGILAIPTESISTTRWRLAPAADTVRALIRVADPAVAAQLAGWRDALLDVLGAPEVGTGS